MKYSRKILLLVTLLFVSFHVSAEPTQDTTQKNSIEADLDEVIEKVIPEMIDHEAPSTENVVQSLPFNAGKMIIDHISDAHDWHLWGEGHESVSISLPVILYSQTDGLKLFSSSHFHHGMHPHEGYVLIKLPGGGESIEREDKATDFYDFSITKNVAALFLGIILILFVFASISSKYKNGGSKKAPKGLQALIEPLILFIKNDIAKANIGVENYSRFVPYLLTLFFFIFFNNLMSLLPFFPGGANLIGNIAVPLTLAVVTYMVVLTSANGNFWSHIFWPPVPHAIKPLMIPIEIMGFFIKPIVLTLRLFANMTAGHIIGLAFMSLIFIFAEKFGAAAGFGTTLISVPFKVGMAILEVLVCFLQAYVFTLLSSIYIGAAVEEAHH